MTTPLKWIDVKERLPKIKLYTGQQFRVKMKIGTDIDEKHKPLIESTARGYQEATGFEWEVRSYEEITHWLEE